VSTAKATWQTASRLDAAKASSSASCVAFARAAPESETSETVTCANAAASAPMASTAAAATVTFGACPAARMMPVAVGDAAAVRMMSPWSSSKR